MRRRPGRNWIGQHIRSKVSTRRAEPSRGRDGTREAYLYSVTVGLNNRITYTFLFYLLVLNETFKKASMDIPQATASETPFRS